MDSRSRKKRLAASASFLALGLVLGFGISQLGSAAAGLPEGAAIQQVTPASRSAAPALAQAIPQGTFVQVAQQVQPAVVSIESEHAVHGRRTSPNIPDFFRRFLDERDPRRNEGGEDEQPPQISQGSGFLVSQEGYVLTNAHVVTTIDTDPNKDQVEVETRKAERITVTLSNEDEYEAEIVGVDIGTDVAVLKIDAGDHLPSAHLGNSDNAQVGEWVLAIGAPFGLTNTVSAGIISAKGRGALRGLQANFYQDFLQTDAAINPGNSGGPLVNLRGEIIGINTAIVSNGLQPQFSGVGFATPINLVRTVMDQLIANGRVIRGWLGVTIAPLDKDHAEAFGVAEMKLRGAVYLNTVEPGDPADQAGLEPTDVVIAMNGERLHGNQDFLQRIALVPPGETVTLTVIRDREERTFKVTLAERPPEEEIYRRQIADGRGQRPERRRQSTRSDSDRLGMDVVQLTPRLARQFGFTDAEGGVLVQHVAPNGPAARAGVRSGHLILEANKKPIASPQELDEILASVEPGRVVLLRVISPNGQRSFLTPRMPER
ncbi:MAG: trypsin-like peptidase domain-containing protein [Acidobacteriota bacterium]